MNPIYKFVLSAGADSQQAYPIFKDDLAIDYALEQSQQFYRGKLAGQLTFDGSDYVFIRSRAFDTQFNIVIHISYNGGQTWAVYWSGQFWKTDCKFNEDDQTAIVTPNVNDRYNDVLAGLEKEYNLIDLAPVIQPVKIDKRPMIQVYVPGQEVIGCFLSGMWWEQECEAVSDESQLQSVYHFWKNKAERIVNVTQQGSPVIPDLYHGLAYNINTTGRATYTNGAYRFVRNYIAQSGGSVEKFYIERVSDGQKMWWYQFVNQSPRTYPLQLTLSPMDGSGATGNVQIYIHDIPVYARYVTDVVTALGITTYPIPEEDIVENNRNYTRVLGYDFPDTIAFSDALTATPTKWGIYQPGQYYQPPTTLIQTREWFPIARAAWERISVWFTFTAFDWVVEESWRKEYTLKDAYPLWSVISVLLGQIAPGITHDGTAAYSQFLYDSNPISYIEQKLFITPKSNLITSGYDQPAQKAIITLKTITNMLRDCFRCYWFIDDQNRFRIEHISYFMRGGTYTGNPVVGIDVTAEYVLRSGKTWAFARNQYQFDKPEMASRYQFGWMDDVTELFNGYPIDIISKYVNPDNIEEIDVSNFTSDVDYILLNPGDISKDGFVLLAASFVSGQYKLAYVDFTYNYTHHILQNAWVSFMYLQRYYMFDMPSRNVQINGVEQFVRGIKKLKTQTLKFPVWTEPNMMNLVKTELGDGVIQKMSVNLSSRNADTTLKYDTE